ISVIYCLFLHDALPIYNVDLKYVNVPVMLKLYIMSHKLSIEAGPQFGYLTDHNLGNVIETEDFDFSLAGGISFYITKNIFIQGRDRKSTRLNSSHVKIS